MQFMRILGLAFDGKIGTEKGVKATAKAIGLPLATDPINNNHF